MPLISCGRSGFHDRLSRSWLRGGTVATESDKESTAAEPAACTARVACGGPGRRCGQLRHLRSWQGGAVPAAPPQLTVSSGQRAVRLLIAGVVLACLTSACDSTLDRPSPTAAAVTTTPAAHRGIHYPGHPRRSDHGAGGERRGDHPRPAGRLRPRSRIQRWGRAVATGRQHLRRAVRPNRTAGHDRGRCSAYRRARGLWRCRAGCNWPDHPALARRGRGAEHRHRGRSDPDADVDRYIGAARPRPADRRRTDRRHPGHQRP